MSNNPASFRRVFVTLVATLSAHALLMAAGAGTAFAQKAGPMDKKAVEIFQGMSDYLAKAETMSFRARSFFDEVRDSGIKIKKARAGTVLLQRPDKLHVESIFEDGAARTTWFDGSKLTIWDRHVNQVRMLDFKGTTDQLIVQLEDEHDVNLPLADLLFSDVNKALADTIISSEHLGTTTVDGVKCHHLSFESSGADWQIWIEADSTPLPRRFVITYVTEKGEPQFQAQLDQWSIGTEIDDASFIAGVPESVKKVAFDD